MGTDLSTIDALDLKYLTDITKPGYPLIVKILPDFKDGVYKLVSATSDCRSDLGKFYPLYGAVSAYKPGSPPCSDPDSSTGSSDTPSAKCSTASRCEYIDVDHWSGLTFFYTVEPGSFPYRTPPHAFFFADATSIEVVCANNAPTCTKMGYLPQTQQDTDQVKAKATNDAID